MNNHLCKICNKQYITKKHNNSFSTSKPEEQLYEYLISIFPNTQRQYKSDLYPYMCDFYIPEKDLYIELNAHWTHGKEPYNSRLKKHKEKLKLWKEKNTKFYDDAVRVWTNMDVKKRKIAKKNNLNYLEIFEKDINKIKEYLSK